MIPIGIIAKHDAGFNAPLAATFLQAAVTTGTSSSYTFTSQNLGTAAASREVVVAVSHNHTAARVVTGVTVAGITASLVVQDSVSTQVGVALWKASVPSGATGNVVVTLNGVTDAVYIALWHVTGGISGQTTSSNQNSVGFTIAATVTGVTNGVVIAALNWRDGASGRSVTWTGVTERYDARSPSANMDTSGGESTTVGSVTATATTTHVGVRSLVVAAFAP